MVRRHLSYANVMATIAVFIALGGTGYALTISGANIKNRSVKGIDITKNSITGTEVKESSFGSVKKSLLANRATLASRADTATKADTATTAQNAANASQLGSLGPSQFLRSSVLVRGATGNVTATSPETILDLPALTARVTTDGDADAGHDLRIANSLPGSAALVLATQTGDVPIAAGTNSTLEAQPTVAVFALYSASVPGLGVTLLCSFHSQIAPARMTCQAIGF